jgi:3-deoxy-D-manno-octulosonic-acid transferase
MRAATSLVQAMQSAYPGMPVLLTCMTATGRQTAHQLFGKSVTVRFLPYDYPWAVRRFLGLHRPRLGVMMETEIWPELAMACKASKVPLYLVNARMSEKSAGAYARFASLTAHVLGMLSGVSAQYEDDANRLRNLGAASVQLTGSLKFDMKPDPLHIERGLSWRAAWGRERPAILAASTRPGEEALILEAFAAHAPAAWLLVLVPRHPQRFDEVASMLEKARLRFLRKSSGAPVSAETRVLLGDSMGEMTSYYAACDLAFIGGSLLPHGGQNLIEAAACGVPVLIGPHTFNFSRIAEMAETAGAAMRVENAGDLMQKIGELVHDRRQREAMSQDALRFAESHRGATARAMAMLAGNIELNQRDR